MVDKKTPLTCMHKNIRKIENPVFYEWECADCGIAGFFDINHSQPHIEGLGELKEEIAFEFFKYHYYKHYRKDVFLFQWNNILGWEKREYYESADQILTKLQAYIASKVKEAEIDEAQNILNCVMDAKRVHPDWGIDDVIELLKFRSQTRKAIRGELPQYKANPKCKKCGGKGTYYFRLPDDVGSPNEVSCDCLKEGRDE